MRQSDSLVEDFLKEFQIVVKESVFIVGVPCSGKDRIIRHLKETGHWQETNLAGIPKSLDTQKLIISCSPETLDEIRRANDMLRENFFATSLIFVDTSNEISKHRNDQRAARGQRPLNEHIRFSKHKTARACVNELAQIFEGKTIVVDNSSNLPANREEATNSLRKIYTDDTPGQSKPKRRLRPKVQPKVQSEVNTQPVSQGLPTGGIGGEIAVDGSGGFTTGLGSAVSMPWTRLSETVRKWATDPKTIAKFADKYRENATTKLYETACDIDSMMSKNPVSSGPKSLKSIRADYKQKKI